MSTLTHRFDEATAERPPLRLLERRPRPVAAPEVAEAPHAVDRWLDRWLVHWVDAYFAYGERMRPAHRMGSWQMLK